MAVCNTKAIMPKKRSNHVGPFLTGLRKWLQSKRGKKVCKAAMLKRGISPRSQCPCPALYIHTCPIRALATVGARNPSEGVLAWRGLFVAPSNGCRSALAALSRNGTGLLLSLSFKLAKLCIMHVLMSGWHRRQQCILAEPEH